MDPKDSLSELDPVKDLGYHSLYPESVSSLRSANKHGIQNTSAVTAFGKRKLPQAMNCLQPQIVNCSHTWATSDCLGRTWEPCEVPRLAPPGWTRSRAPPSHRHRSTEGHIRQTLGHWLGLASPQQVRAEVPENPSEPPPLRTHR